MAEGGGSNGAEGSSAARGRWNALAENSRQRRPKGVEGTVRFRTSFHNVVYDVFRARAWKETDSDVDWDVCWADTGAPREYRTYHCAHASPVHLVPCTTRRTAQDHTADQLQLCRASALHLPCGRPLRAQVGSARTSTPCASPIISGSITSVTTMSSRARQARSRT